MKRLSEIIKEATLHRNPEGVDDVLVFEFEGKEYSRKITYEYFSNYPIVSIMFQKVRWLVDVSCIEITWKENF